MYWLPLARAQGKMACYHLLEHADSLAAFSITTLTGRRNWVSEVSSPEPRPLRHS